MTPGIKQLSGQRDSMDATCPQKFSKFPVGREYMVQQSKRENRSETTMTASVLKQDPNK